MRSALSVIGLRMAVGATTRAVQIQFPGEAVMLSMLGAFLESLSVWPAL